MLQRLRAARANQSGFTLIELLIVIVILGVLAGIVVFAVTAFNNQGVDAQMVRVGEDTGTLDAQLEVAARYYEGELDYRLKKLTALFEPAVIVVMGLLVGFVAIALVSAMYGIFNQVHV